MGGLVRGNDKKHSIECFFCVFSVTLYMSVFSKKKPNK